MKNSSEKERRDELDRAKASHRRWITNSKVLDYREFEPFMKDGPAGEDFCHLMTERGFVMLNQPTREDNQKKIILRDAQTSIEDTCTRLLNGEQVEQELITDYRRFCLAVLTENHNLTAKQACDFKVMDLFFTNIFNLLTNLHSNLCVINCLMFLR